MLQIISNVDHIKFEVENALDSQLGVIPLPFAGMDKSGAAICFAYRDNGICKLGNLCPFRHIKHDKNIVCKHWLRGLCKKGDDCEFLHEYDMTKMPECYFFSKYNACSNKECPFLHIDPESKIKDCPWYDRGFCRHGPVCKNRHVCRVICSCYIHGFCPDGKKCKFIHPKFDAPQDNNFIQQNISNPFPLIPNFSLYPPPTHVPLIDQDISAVNRPSHLQSLQPPSYMVPKVHFQPANKNIIHIASFKRTQNSIICHFCGEIGHKLSLCPRLNVKDASELMELENESLSFEKFNHPHNPFHRPRPVRRNLDEVTCFRCGERGHFANQCSTIFPLRQENT